MDGTDPMDASASDVARTPRLTEAQFERFQRICRAALELLVDQEFGIAENDEWFYRELRDGFVAAGATDGEIDALAAWLVTRIVDWTPNNPTCRHEQFELIAEHLACADMTVRIGQGDTYVWVEFPNRPKIH